MMPTSSRSKAASRRQGFTLIELMVALIAGSFVVAAAYALSGLVARNFHEQTRVTDVQAALRTAMEQVKRDASRAGFLGAPTTNQLPDCSGVVTPGVTSAEISPRPVHAIQVLTNVMSAQVAAAINSAENLTRADQLLLTGNYATSEAYLTVPNGLAAAGSVALQTQHESFRRTFINPTDGTLQADRFTDVFRVGRMLRFEDLSTGRILFRDITGADATDPSNPTITFNPPVPPGCIPPGASAAVAPISLIRYQLETRSDSNDLNRTTDDTSAAAAGGGRALLIRRELNMTDGSPMNGALRVVLDYLVELQVNAWIFDGAPAFTRITDTTPTTLNAVSAANPEQFRSLLLTLSSRTPESQARPGARPFAGASRNGRANLNQPYLMFFQRESADQQTQFYARVRTLRSDVFLPNMIPPGGP